MLQLRGISCLLISFSVLSLMLLQLRIYKRFFVILFWFSLIPPFVWGHLHRDENSGHSCFHLGFNHTNPPIQTLAAAGAAVHLSAVRCHPENIKKLLVSWTVAPGAAETRQPQFKISRLHVWIWACHGGWFCPSHVLFFGKTSISGVQLDSQTFFILTFSFMLSAPEFKSWILHRSSKKAIWALE